MNARDKARVVSTSPILRRLSAEAQRSLAEMMKVERFEAGDVVCARGEVAESAWLVAGGVLDVFVGEPPQRARSLGAGELIGEYGMFGEQLRTATVKARDEVTLLTVDYTRFRRFLMQFPEALWTLCELAVARLTELERATQA